MTARQDLRRRARMHDQQPRSGVLPFVTGMAVVCALVAAVAGVLS